MAKIIKYYLHGNKVHIQTPWSDLNESIAKLEALDGKYEIEEDRSIADPMPTQEERIANLEAAIEAIPSMISAAVKAALAAGLQIN